MSDDTVSVEPVYTAEATWAQDDPAGTDEITIPVEELVQTAVEPEEGTEIMITQVES